MRSDQNAAGEYNTEPARRQGHRRWRMNWRMNLACEHCDRWLPARSIALENESATLRPQLFLHDVDWSRIGGAQNDSPAGNVRANLDAARARNLRRRSRSALGVLGQVHAADRPK
jgi:hypothetical protein